MTSVLPEGGFDPTCPDPGLPDAALPDTAAALSDVDFPADPYPGTAPDHSFVHLDGHSHRLIPARQLVD